MSHMTTMNKTMNINHKEFMFIRDRLQQQLEEAQKLREEKSQWIHNELEWVTHERNVMYTAVNQQRINLGLSVITMGELKRAESSAEGHTDYTPKFSLYCAWLAVGRTTSGN